MSDRLAAIVILIFATILCAFICTAIGLVWYHSSKIHHDAFEHGYHQAVGAGGTVIWIKDNQ